MHYNWSKEMFSGRAKPIRVIGFPNQFPVNWRSAIYLHALLTSELDGTVSFTPDRFYL
jgi:hypothetical protein